VIDDPVNLEDFRYAFENRKKLIICDPHLCNPATLTKAVSYLSKYYARKQMSFVYFENDVSKCLKNIEYRNDGRIVTRAGLESFNYQIPHQVIPLKIWQKEDMNNNSSDCRTSEGIAIGLVDGIISMARVLKRMNIRESAYIEALKDLRSDEDVAWLLKYDTHDSKEKQ
jgi:hypothetical protein